MCRVHPTAAARELAGAAEHLPPYNTMSKQSLLSPENQGVTFVELFFDLVFVFAITQVTRETSHHLDAHGLLRGVLVFWLIWWGWTQFTWALNAADTNHHYVRVGTLISTGVAFVMAGSVYKAFVAGPAALWFAGSYVAVRTLGLGLYYQVVAANAGQRSAVAGFASLSVGGLAAVLVGGFVAPSLREWLWVGAIALDLVAAGIAGNRATWCLHAGHFAERHGLIIIIALGESLIVSGSALTSNTTSELMITGAVAVLITCLLWWTYFGWVHGVLERRLEAHTGEHRSRLGRDAFSFGYFPLVSGIIALAVGFEASFHPAEYTVLQVSVAIGAGLTLFLVSTAAALWRAEGCVLWNRLIVLILTLLALTLSRASSPNQILSVACAGLALIVAIEQVTVRKRLGGT